MQVFAITSSWPASTGGVGFSMQTKGRGNFSRLSSGSLCAIIIAMLGALSETKSAVAQVPCRYTVEYLPNPSPCAFWNRYIEPTGISPNGRYVCGSIDDCGTGGFAVVVDTQGMQMTIIPRPLGVISMRGYGVNDNKEVCGFLTHFLGTGGDRAFLWRNGVLTELGVPPSATDSFAYAINNKTEITGECAPGRQAYLWGDGKFTLLILPVGWGSVGFDIDDSSRIVGYMGGNEFTSHAFLWSAGRVTDLGVIPDGDSAAAFSISANGCIAGFGADYDFPSGQQARAFFYQDGQMINLGLLPSAIWSQAFSTNGVSTIGTCGLVNDSVAFVFTSGTMRRLDQLQTNPNLIIQSSRSISIDGSIAAHGRIAGTHHGIVLRPINSPTGDVTLDCRVSVPDLLAVINSWGSCGNNPFCSSDVNNDGVVNHLDLLIVLQHWAQQT